MHQYCKASLILALLLASITGTAYAHHSFAMYDIKKIMNVTGVVTKINPASAHLVLYIAPLNEARDSVLRDEEGEPIEWAVEMGASAAAARNGISVNGFPRGSIVSIGLHPLRNGRTAGGRGKSGLFKCPPNTPPAPGMHCDSVEGSTTHGKGVMQDPTDPLSGL